MYVRACFPAFASIALLLAGCPAEETEDPGEHACEHTGVAGTAATAAADRAGDADAAIEIQEEPWTVALTPGEEGWLSIAVDADTAALMFVGAADVVTGLYLDDGDADELPDGTPDGFCEEDIPEHFHLELAPGTWHLKLGPAAIDSLWLMLMSAEGHEHTEE